MSEKRQRYTDEEIAAAPIKNADHYSLAAYIERSNEARQSASEIAAGMAIAAGAPVLSADRLHPETVTIDVPGAGRMTVVKAYAVERGWIAQGDPLTPGDYEQVYEEPVSEMPSDEQRAAELAEPVVYSELPYLLAGIGDAEPVAPADTKTFTTITLTPEGLEEAAARLAAAGPQLYDAQTGEPVDLNEMIRAMLDKAAADQVAAMEPARIPLERPVGADSGDEDIDTPTGAPIDPYAAMTRIATDEYEARAAAIEEGKQRAADSLLRVISNEEAARALKALDAIPASRLAAALEAEIVRRDSLPKSDTDWSYQHFVTPGWVAEAAYNMIPQRPAPALIYDFGAGTGVWGKEARLRWPNAEIVGLELDDTRPASDGYDRWEVADCATITPAEYEPADLVVSNPPFKLAVPFVRNALEMVNPDGGRVVFLLRLAFLESAARTTFWQECPPEWVAILSKRPSFTGDGATDTKTAYAIFCWRRGNRPIPPELRIVGSEPPYRDLKIGSTPYGYEQ